MLLSGLPWRISAAVGAAAAAAVRSADRWRLYLNYLIRVVCGINSSPAAGCAH
ncbi:hypothetical protein Taro_034104 [Colocasia esculenta]|uniref:Uncharacterized protein n=1 Tax=Colocasia esculenta TaxID=4460 RepID=A0A843W362_COLES|nr:hypothetical protein [Colocasia esculenta]